MKGKTDLLDQNRCKWDDVGGIAGGQGGERREDGVSVEQREAKSLSGRIIQARQGRYRLKEEVGEKDKEEEETPYVRKKVSRCRGWRMRKYTFCASHSARPIFLCSRFPVTRTQARTRTDEGSQHHHEPCRLVHRCHCRPLPPARRSPLDPA